MTKNTRFLLASLFLSLPLWWGTNIYSAELTEIFFLRELATNPEILAAQASQIELEKQLAAKRPTLRRDVQKPTIEARAAFSLFYSQERDNKVLFQQSSQSPHAIASITKLMTALIALENYPLYSEISITPDILDKEENGVKFQQGEVFRTQDLIYSTLIESSNEAALALADVMGRDVFIEMMNLKARELQLSNTLFINPNGLDPEDPAGPINYSSTQDIATFTIYLLEHYHDIFDILSQTEFILRTADNQPHHKMTNTNILLEHPDLEARTVGGKTGWTSLAQGTLLHVLKSPKGNGYIINVVLGSKDRFGEMKSLIDWIDQSYIW